MSEHTYTVTDGPKMLRETLCAVQNLIGNAGDARRREHSGRLQRLIDECDRKRPIGASGKHGDLHTSECGCEDAPRQEAPVPFVPTLLPGDRVRFNGHDWYVFISMRHQAPDSPVVIWRPREGLGEITITRLQRELTLIPITTDRREPQG